MTLITTLTQFSGIRISINQVEYTSSPDGPVIHIFGRDEQGMLQHLEVSGFRPYFYVPVEQAEGMDHPVIVEMEKGVTYRSIKGVPLRRLYTRRPMDVRDIRDRYEHYEADIPFTTRFMIDCHLTGGVLAPALHADYANLTPVEVQVPARVCILDIECDDAHGFPSPDKDPIICITCWDSFTEDYVTFLLKSCTPLDVSARQAEGGLQNGCFREGIHTICSYTEEREMLQGLVTYFRDRDPDIVSGWNFLGFDLPYITGRMNVLGLAPESLSRLPEKVERSALRGRALFDLLDAYKKMLGVQKESYRLDAIAEEELGERKVRYQGTLSQLWKEHPENLVEYNFKDVELCVGIDQKNKIIDFYREIARYVGCPLDRTLNSSSVIDIYILRKAHSVFVLPSKGYAAAEEFEGATVFDPTRGVKEHVVVLDLKSLYPMAMMTINASPETKDPAGELRAPNGIRFRARPDGLTRSIISELLRERENKKQIRNRYPFGSPQYILYDIQQNVLKVLMNTYYGVSGYTRFRLYDREIGSAITAVGRAIIEHTRKMIEDLGYHVLYGDTDSCMIQIPPSDKETLIAAARDIEGRVNKSYDEFARTVLGADTHYFSIKFEKIYQRFFQAGRKKRYAGLLVWKEGKDVDEVDVVGFEIRRSDSPQITRMVQKKVIGMILRGEKYATVRAYLEEVIRNYRAGKYPLDEIGIPGGIGKDLDQYDTDDAQIRGAKYANTHLGATFTRGSKPKRVYIKYVKKKYPQTDVLCFEYGDQVPPEFVVDWETMLDKTVKQPITRIIEAVGWDWHDIDPSLTTLSQFGL
jgi:DNA polymerase I